MSSDSEYQRVELDTAEPSKGRIRGFLDSLQEGFTQTVETVTRQARFEISGGGVDTVDAPDNLDELVDEAKKVGFVWRAFDIFANEVWEPGFRLEGPDETLAFLLGDTGEVDALPPDDAPDGGFLANCGVYAGVKKSDFYHIGKQATFQRRLRGTVLVEMLKNDPETPIPDTKITGFNFVRPETISAETYPYSNILIEPEDTDVDGVDITQRGEAAAYIQWEDSSILGRTGRMPDDKAPDTEDIPLSKNDLKKQVLNPGIGDDASQEQGIFGTSEIEPIAEDIAEYRQIKRDRATAIQNKAHGVYFIEHGRDVLDLGNGEIEVIEWDNDSMDSFESDLSGLEPGGYITHDASVEVDRKEGDVPDLTDTMAQIVDDIFAGLPVPKYKVGFSDNINRDVTSEQSDDSQRQIQEERKYQERWWTEQLKLVAETWDLPTEGLRLKIEPEPQDSPVLSLSETEINKLATYAQALNSLAGPRGGPRTLVDEETLLTEVAQLPESVNEVEELEPAETENPDAMQDFIDIMERGMGNRDTLDFEPELHPRDEEGKFTEAGGTISNLIEGAFEAFGDERDRQTVENLTQTWAGWPTDSDTAPMWQAAERQTGNINAPTDISGIPMLDIQADKSDISTYEEYSDHVTETLSEVADSDTITAHRFLHGEAAERLRNGESLPPRTLASWTTDENTLSQLIQNVPTPEGDFVDPEDAVIVTKEIPIENVADHHAVNPVLNEADQQEAVIALPETDDLSDAQVREASEVVQS